MISNFGRFVGFPDIGNPKIANLNFKSLIVNC